MLNQVSLTMLTIGGDYTKAKTLGIEDVLPFAFLYGMGGPRGQKRNRITVEECICR